MPMARIASAGSAGRIPVGAMSDMMRGIQGETARKVAGAAPGMKALQKESQGKYFNALNRYSMGQRAASDAKFGRFMGDLGGMTALAMLSRAGYFNQGGQLQGWSPDQVMGGDYEKYLTATGQWAL